MDIASHAHKRKLEAEFSFQAAVAQEMRIDGALDDREAQARGELVFQLFPDKFSVRFFGFHGSIQSGIRGVESRKFKVERKRKNSTQRPQRTQRSQRIKVHS